MSDGKSSVDELVEYLESTSPIQYLTDISGGKKPSSNDIGIIEGIMSKTRLNSGVMNVLIEYVMIRTDMKLSKNYIEKIAEHWSRKQVKTVREAMELAKREQQQYICWKDSKRTQVSSVSANRDKLNAKVLELIKIYNTGEQQEYALGGLETLSEVFGVDLVARYIKK